MGVEFAIIKFVIYDLYIKCINNLVKRANLESNKGASEGKRPINRLV